MGEPVFLSPAGVEVDAIAFVPGGTETGSLPGIACSTATPSLLGFTLHVDAGGSTARGSLAWDRPAGSRAWQVHALPRPPLPGEPCVFAGREDGSLLALDAGGEPAWSHAFSATVSAFTVFDDPVSGEPLLLVPGLDKTLRLLGARDGKLAWGDTFQSGVNVARAGWAGEGLFILAAGGNDNTLRVYQRPPGAPASRHEMAWYHAFEGYVRDVDMSPAGHVAAVADDGFLKVFDVHGGKVLFQHEHRSFAWKCRIAGPRVLSSSYRVPVAPGEDGEGLGNPGTVTCHDLASGALLWETGPADGINVNAWDLARDGDGWLVAAGTTGGDVLLLDAATGRTRQAWSTGSLVNDVRMHRVPGGPLLLAWCVERDVDSACIVVLEQ